MIACKKCFGPTIPHTERCFECGPGANPPARTRRVVRVGKVPEAERARVLALLGTLTERDPRLLAWIVGRGRFELEIDATDAQKDQLQALLSAAGLEVRVWDQPPPDPGHTVRWSRARHAIPKLVVTVAAGVAAIALAVPWVPAAALLTAAIVAGRGVELVPNRLEVGRGVADRVLSVIDESLLAEADGAQRGLADAEARGILRTCISHFAEIMWVLRTGGGHLRLPELGRIDAQVQRLLRQTLKLSTSADRVRPPDDLPDEDPRVVKMLEVRAEVVRRIREIEGALDRLRSSVNELHAPEVRADDLVAPRRALSELEVSVDAALEVAELVSRPVAARRINVTEERRT